MRTFIGFDEGQSFVRIQGVSDAFARMYAWDFLAGANFSSASTDEVIAGRSIASEIFGSYIDALGKRVQLRDSSFEIVGVIDDSTDDHNQVLFIPWERLQSTINKQNLDSIIVSTNRAGEAASVAEEISLSCVNAMALLTRRMPKRGLAI